ncbi:MAG: hypothetical protein ACR2G5_04645 [Pyrinomonadaceae bacterium]
MVPKYQADAQQVIDDLFNEHLIPFKLVAQKVIEVSPGEMRIPFYDSRLPSVTVEVGKDTGIKDQVRSAVLASAADYMRFR